MASWGLRAQMAVNGKVDAHYANAIAHDMLSQLTLLNACAFMCPNGASELNKSLTSLEHMFKGEHNHPCHR